MSSPAASVARDKAQHPERYCPDARCLWRTGDGSYCPRHAPANDSPAVVAATIAVDAARGMLDTSWTPTKGYAHAAGIAARLSAHDARGK